MRLEHRLAVADVQTLALGIRQPELAGRLLSPDGSPGGRRAGDSGVLRTAGEWAERGGQPPGASLGASQLGGTWTASGLFAA